MRCIWIRLITKVDIVYDFMNSQVSLQWVLNKKLCCDVFKNNLYLKVKKKIEATQNSDVIKML